MKIIICIPFYNKNICEETLQSVNTLVNSNIPCEVRMSRGTYIGFQRNFLICNNTKHLIKPKLPEDETHYLCMDDGNILTPEQLQCLINYHVPIISAAYTTRENNKVWCAGYFSKIQQTYLPVTEKGFHDDIDFVGAGALLIEREVFEKLEYPWFRHELINFKNKYSFQTGEDIGFCLAAKKAGYKIAIDCDCISKHNHSLKGENEMEQKTSVTDLLLIASEKSIRMTRSMGQALMDMSDIHKELLLTGSDLMAEKEKSRKMDVELTNLREAISKKDKKK